jgi:hypothetical protein
VLPYQHRQLFSTTPIAAASAAAGGTKATFSMEKQHKFVEALAAVVGVKEDNINITDIKDVAAGKRRRLQQAGVEVAYNVSGATNNRLLYVAVRHTHVTGVHVYSP